MVISHWLQTKCFVFKGSIWNMSSYCWTFTLWPLSLFIHIVYGRFTGIEAILRLLWWKWSLDSILNMWNSMLHTMCKFECIISNIWKIISLTTPRSFICQMTLKIQVKGTPSYVSWGIECHANINTENRELSWSEISVIDGTRCCYDSIRVPLVTTKVPRHRQHRRLSSRQHPVSPFVAGQTECQVLTKTYVSPELCWHGMQCLAKFSNI